jgi:hypothetical protein
MVHLDSSDTPPPSGHDVLVYELMNICIRRLLNISCACVDPWAYLVIISCTVVVNLSWPVVVMQVIGKPSLFNQL